MLSLYPLLSVCCGNAGAACLNAVDKVDTVSRHPLSTHGAVAVAAAAPRKLCGSAATRKYAICVEEVVRCCDDNAAAAAIEAVLLSK